MLRVSQVGVGGGGSATWDGGPNMGVFFLNEPSLTPFWDTLKNM